MRAPNGRFYTISGPPNATDAQVRAKILEQHPEAGKPAPISRTEAVLAGAERGMKPVAEFASRFNPLSGVVDAATEYLFPGSASKRERALAQQAAKAQAQRPNYFTGGQIAGEVAATAPLLALGGGAIQAGGKLVSQFVPRAANVGRVVQRVGAATRTGGIGSGRTAAQTAKLTLPQRGADLAQRVVGGAIAGTGGAALNNQDIVSGATVGGLLPVVVGAAGGAVGKVVDAGALVGQLVGLFRSDKVQAAKLFREALGTNLEAARQVFANLAPDDQRLARRVLIDEGVEPDTFMALGANMEALRPEQVRAIKNAETAAARQGLEQAANVPSGGTLTDVRAATRAGREEVSNAMTPKREGAFAQSAEVSEADVLAREAFRRKAAADTLAAQEADAAQRLSGASTFFGDSPAFVRGADAATDRAAAAAQTADEQAAIAQQMEYLVAQAAAKGVPPLNGVPLVAELRRMATQPGTRVNKVDRPALLELANTIQRNMDENGMVNALDMYELRRSGVSDAISTLQTKISGGLAPRSGTTQKSSELMGQVQTLFDDALGEPFKDYLQKSAEGYAAVNRQQIAGEALHQFNTKNFGGFLDLVGRKNPEAIGRITQGGPKMEDIANVFAMDPTRMAAFKDAESLLQSRNKMDELARSGAVNATRLMNIETPSKLRAATRVALSAAPAGRIGLEGVEQLAGNFMRPKISDRMAEGFMSGQNANTLLNTYSTPLMFDDVISRLPPNIRNMLAQSARQSSNSDQR
jgi:hypothetical protein